MGWNYNRHNFGEGLDFPGSYYANPQYDEPSPQKDNTPDAAPGTYTHPNVWPKEDIPEFEETFKKLGSLFVHVGELLAKAMDLYVSKMIPEQEKRMQNVIKTTRAVKGRLLHYFPQTADKNKVNY